MKVILESISITNFRGIATFLHNFKSGTNVLSAPFGYGKTTIKEAFLYGLGLPIKNIKPCKFENHRWVEIPHLEPEITLTLTIDNDRVILTRGEKGTQSVFKVDDEKVGTLKNYQERVLTYFGLKDIETLKDLVIIGNFLERDNKEIRKILFDLTNANEVLVEFQNSYDTLKQDFIDGLTTDDISLNIKRELKQVENDKLILQTKIQTYNEFLSTHENDNIKEIKTKVENLEKAKSKAHYDLERMNSDLLSQYNKILNSIEKEKKRIDTAVDEIAPKIEEIRYSLINDERLLKEAQDELDNAQASTVEPTTTCPYCGQVLPKNNNFDKLQAERREQRIQDAIKRVNEIKKSIERKNQNKDEYQAMIRNINDTSQLGGLNTALNNVKARLMAIEQDTKPLKDYISELEQDLDKYKSLLSNAQIVEEQQTLLKQAQTDLKDLLVKTQTIFQKSDELKDYLSKIESKLTTHINDFFVAEESGLGWKLYENAKNGNLLTQIELMYQNQKQYSTCSRGEQLDANCMLTFFLQGCYDLYLPIFIDNISDLGGKSYQSENQIIYLQTNNNRNNFEIEKY